MHVQEKYNNLPVDVKVTHLLAAIHTSTLKEEARHMAAVILRRLFASEFQEFYTAVSRPYQFIVELVIAHQVRTYQFY